MSETSIICPHCGQKDTSNAKLAYCSFCYTRFEKHEPAQSDPQKSKESSDSAEENKESPAESEQTEVQDNPVEETATESAPLTPKEIVYTDVICPFCRARTPHQATTCPECERDLTSSWL